MLRFSGCMASVISVAIACLSRLRLASSQAKGNVIPASPCYTSICASWLTVEQLHEICPCHQVVCGQCLYGCPSEYCSGAWDSRNWCDFNSPQNVGHIDPWVACGLPWPPSSQPTSPGTATTPAPITASPNDVTETPTYAPLKDSPTTSPNTVTPRKCPRGYTYYTTLNKCYAVYTSRMSWFAASQYCSASHKRSHLLTIANSAEENLLWTNVISQYNIAVWIALNKVDHPSRSSVGSSLQWQWYLLGNRMIRDNGYRGQLLDSTLVPETCNDNNCVAWEVSDGVNKHWQVRSCSNKPTADDRYVEGFACQIDL